MPKLYEISNEYIKLLEMAEDNDFDLEMLEDTIESITEDFNDKADNIACAIKELQLIIDGIEKEKRVLESRLKAKKNQVTRLSKYLYDQMILTNTTKIESSRNIVSIRNNPKSVNIENELGFIQWATKENKGLLKEKQPEPNKTAIKEALNKGIEIPYVSFQAGNRLDIK